MSNSLQIELAPIINLNTIGALKAQLDDAVSKNTDVALLGVNVEKVDTAAMQLLAVFGERIKADGNILSWIQPSDEVGNVAALLGLESALCLVVKD